MERMAQSCCKRIEGGRIRPLNDKQPGAGTYLPLKISQSPCEVPMNRSIGRDSQALAREATKACRASSGAAGGPPVNAPIIRLLLGQMMPQTLSSIRMP